MENYGLSTVSAILGDMLVYRNLQPMESRLPPFEESAARAGIARHMIPRKSQPDYARVMVALLHAARALDGAGATLQCLVYVGDTRMNDGVAFRNLCQAGGWQGIAFIGAENREEARVELVAEGDATLYLANRWSLLASFDTYCQTHNFPLDAGTAVVLDLDKTTLGARGRNDHVIDSARVEAVRQTVAELLGTAFDVDQFESSYTLLNQPEFHPFTSDNQDYLAYMCLMLGAGLFERQTLVEQIRAGDMANFEQFLETAQVRSGNLPPQLQTLHANIYERVRMGDATPFKAFRYTEYKTTIGRMGHLGEKADVPALLAGEIVLTHEICEIARLWKQRGALLLGLSDKPDEASVPTQALADRGFQPIHRTATHVVGVSPESANVTLT